MLEVWSFHDRARFNAILVFSSHKVNSDIFEFTESAVRRDVYPRVPSSEGKPGGFLFCAYMHCIVRTVEGWFGGKTKFHSFLTWTTRKDIVLREVGRELCR